MTVVAQPSARAIDAAPGSRATVAGRGGWTFAFTAATLATAVYLLTLSANYNSDGMAFVRLAAAADLAGPLFFQAEHLLYPFVPWLIYGAALQLGYSGGPLAPFQIINTVAGGVAIGAFALLAYRWVGAARGDGWRRVGGSFGAAVATLALAASWGWWFHSSDAEDQIIANAAALVAIAALAVGGGPIAGRWLLTARGWLIVGGFALAFLSHATTVLALPAAIVLLVARRATAREWLLLPVVGAIITLGLLIAIGVGAHGITTIDGWRSWLLAAPGKGVWGQIGVRNLWQGAQSMAAAAIYLPDPPTLAQLRADPLRGIGGFGATALVVGGFVAALVAAGRALARRDYGTAALGVWALTVAAFGAYWAPDDFQFWMFLLPPLYLLAARAWPVAGFAAVALPIVVWNLTAGALPRHDPATNTGLIVTRCLSERLRPNDLLITPGWDWAGDYVPYFTAIPVVSLQDVYVLAARNDPSAFFREVDRRIAETRASGGRVYLVRLDTMTADEAAFFRRVTGLSASDFPWRRVDAFRCDPPPRAVGVLPAIVSPTDPRGGRGELVREVLP